MSPELHFLVVDDQPIIRLIIAALLNGLGYTRVSEAADGYLDKQLLNAGVLKVQIDRMLMKRGLLGL